MPIKTTILATCEKCQGEFRYGGYTIVDDAAGSVNIYELDWDDNITEQTDPVYCGPVCVGSTIESILVQKEVP